MHGSLDIPQTSNPYAYSLNNPVNLSDPSGLWAVGGCVSVNAGVGAFGTCSLCAVYTSDKELGLTFSPGFGGTTGVATGVGPLGLYSDANNFEDLSGIDIFAGGSFEVVGADSSFNSKKIDMKTYTVGPMLGPDYSPPFFPGEFHGGFTKTFTLPLIQF